MDYCHSNSRAMSRVKLLADRSPRGGYGGGARAQSANMRLRKLSPRWRRVSISVTDRDRLKCATLNRTTRVRQGLLEPRCWRILAC